MDFNLYKILGSFFNILNFLILLILLVIFFHYFKKKYFKFFLINLLIFLLFFGNIGISSYILSDLESTYKVPNIDVNNFTGVLILGGSFEDVSFKNSSEIPINGNFERVLAPLSLFKINKELKVLYSGYSNKKFTKISEANLAKTFYINFGINEKNIILENKSKNTLENIYFSKKIISNFKGHWLLITSGYHMKRAMMLARKNNLDVVAYPVDWRIKISDYNFFHYNFKKSFNYWDIIIHEYLGIIYYKIALRF